MQLRRWWLIWACALLLSACAGTAPQPAATATPVAPVTPTTIVVWHAFGGSEEYLYTDMLQSIATANGFTVVVQRMPLSGMLEDVSAAWSSGTGPHLVIVNNSQALILAERGLSLKLDAVVAAPRRDAIAQAVRDTTRYTDAAGTSGWYGVPITYALPVLFYNSKSILQAPQTIDDLLVMARSLHNPPDWGLGADITFDTFGGYLTGFGGAVVDEQNRIVIGASGRVGAERWLTWLALLNSDPDLLTRLNGIFSTERTIGAGQVAMVIDSSAQRSTYQRVWGEALVIVPLPRDLSADTAPAPFMQSTALVLNKRLAAHEVRAAQVIIDALLSTERQAVLAANGIQPANRTVDTNNLPAVAAIHLAASSAIAPAPVLLRYDVQRVLQSAVQQVLAGVVTPADAVTNADSQLRSLVEGSLQP
jgi:ABC-type glycerol-3-phosphate transport system substrate-binding protein